MHVDHLRAKCVQFLHPIAGDRHAIVIRNDLDSRFDPFMFWNPLAPSVWLALFLYCLIPSSIMAISDVLLIREKMDLKKFASRIFQSLSSNFGGNFLSRGVQKNYQTTILFYFFNGIIIWIAYRASITAGLSQKIVELPFEVKFFQYFCFHIFCIARYFQL